MVKALLIAGTHSGVGKTTITLGLIAALRRRGLTVQPFKVGPDYIDSSHHTRAAGRPCRNLDTWMMPPERMAELFAKVARDADVALIEGVMGLYDGRDYEGDTGSTAEVARLLEAPVLVVLDASKVARSAAAIAIGYQRFDPSVPLAGFIVNRVGSASHGQGVAGAVEAGTKLPVVGWVPRDDSMHLPERYLGLVPSAESGAGADMASAAGLLVERHLDVDKVLALARSISLGEESRPHARPLENSAKPIIAVARDEAFHFFYEENLVLLEEAGAELKYFSPLSDEALPPNTAGILLSGGFPELYAAKLAANFPLHEALRGAHRRGVPIYAECGGLMYLTESITDQDGKISPMVGVLPGRSVMRKRLTLGYRKARAAASSWLFREKESVRGHEFHYSSWEGRSADIAPAYEIVPARGNERPRAEGACLGSLWASYVHLHFWTKPELADRFVAACAAATATVYGTTQ